MVFTKSRIGTRNLKRNDNTTSRRRRMSTSHMCGAKENEWVSECVCMQRWERSIEFSIRQNATFVVRHLRQFLLLVLLFFFLFFFASSLRCYCCWCRCLCSIFVYVFICTFYVFFCNNIFQNGNQSNTQCPLFFVSLLRHTVNKERASTKENIANSLLNTFLTSHSFICCVLFLCLFQRNQTRNVNVVRTKFHSIVVFFFSLIYSPFSFRFVSATQMEGLHSIIGHTQRTANTLFFFFSSLRCLTFWTRNYVIFVWAKSEKKSIDCVRFDVRQCINLAGSRVTACVQRRRKNHAPTVVNNFTIHSFIFLAISHTKAHTYTVILLSLQLCETNYAVFVCLCWWGCCDYHY